MRVSENRRYLEHDGRPFFYLADTSWKLLSVPTEEEAEHYLRTRKEQGFTVVMPVIATEINRGEEEPSPWVDGDPDRVNEWYFARVDRIVRRANELGLWVALLPAWGSHVGGSERDRPELDAASARRYGEYVGRRYRDADVIWVNGGDRNVGDERLASTWRALAEGLRAGDPGLASGERVMSFHPPGLRPEPVDSGTSGKWFHGDEWLNFNMLQTGLRFLEEDQCARYVAEYARQPTKPFVDGETRYENSHRNFGQPPTGPKIRARHVRQAAYYAMLCGALGHTYGCRDVWSFYVPSDRPPTRGVDTHWKTALRFAGAEQMRHWRRLFEEVCPWYRLAPDLPTITSATGAIGGGENDGALVVRGAWDGRGNIRTPAAVAEDGSFAVVYLPEPMPVWVDLAKVSGKRVDCAWYDPRTGEERPIQAYHEKGVVRFFPPGGESEPDWALVLRAV